MIRLREYFIINNEQNKNTSPLSFCDFGNTSIFSYFYGTALERTLRLVWCFSLATIISYYLPAFTFVLQFSILHKTRISLLFMYSAYEFYFSWISCNAVHCRNKYNIWEKCTFSFIFLLPFPLIPITPLAKAREAL